MSRCCECKDAAIVENGKGCYCEYHAVEAGYEYLLLDVPPLPFEWLNTTVERRVSLLRWGAEMMVAPSRRSHILTVQVVDAYPGRANTVRVWYSD